MFNNIDKAKARMLQKSPFFATLLMGTQILPDATIDTAATDGTKIWYAPEFFSPLTVAQVQFVLAHELAHMMLEHAYRKGSRNHKLFNMAGDYVVNLMLADDGFDVLDGSLLDKAYEGMSTEQVYALLRDQTNPSGSKSDVLGDDIREPEKTSRAVTGCTEIRRRVAQAANVARMAGKMSAGLEAIVNEVLNPRLRWQDLLRDYMTRATKDDESWGRRNRRFQGVYLPARYSESMGEIVIIGDTSGSIGQNDLNQIAAEINMIAETVRPECIRVVWADTVVAGEQTFQTGDKITFEPKGGGGTDMRMPLEYVARYNPEIVVLITDGYTPWPTSEPEYPLIVVCSTSADVPVGHVVRFED